ncbi:rRNA pseudouridine synthase [Aureimonas altamirensis]|uniref:pseudouridine synthase n=1 Tax=Aureimonas altamirensis TaxID=370622 RepID=UPI002036A0BB|nr:pseudouridine synthase [Aureimonas altamirensis]MCM2504687.1 rRNA pseudouridine synthase [Aureimonas altamirensis]
MRKTVKPSRSEASAHRPQKPGGVSLNRVFSKLGIASRGEADAFIRAGRVCVDGRVVQKPDLRIDMGRAEILLDGHPVAAQAPIYLMVNKPRGLVTTLSDPEGRDTIYRCLDGLGLPHVSPVGRLDKASEGLILMTNDTRFSQWLLDPETGPEKTYHVQIDRLPCTGLFERLSDGIVDKDELLRATGASLLRSGTRNAWLEIVLAEGRNRQIRRLLAAFDIGVLRLVRVAIGPLALGALPKGAARQLTPGELSSLTGGNSPHLLQEPTKRALG